MPKLKIAFISSQSLEAQKALHELKLKYSTTTIKNSDVIVALGGDCLILSLLNDVNICSPFFK